MKPESPILLFDSGVGGLSILPAVREALPGAPLIYAADFAGLPYGGKTEAEIAARVCGLLGRLSERYQPRLICIACNTASTIALSMVRDVLETPIVGTVPAIKPAAKLTRTGTFGILGTEATIRQAYVDDLEREHAGGKTMLRHAAPDLVMLAEAKLRGEHISVDAVANACTGLSLQQGGRDIDVVVLACTHFPLLRGELQEAFGKDVTLIDGAQGIARRIAALSDGQEFASGRPDRMVMTGGATLPEPLVQTLETYGLDQIDRI